MKNMDVKWFDFDKCKPSHGETVIGIDTEGNMDIYQYDEEWSGCLMQYNGAVKAFNITHWTFLPNPPDANDSCSIDVVPVVHGQWEDKPNPQWKAYDIRHCTVCGWSIHKTKLRNSDLNWNFCPNCGAKMYGGEDNG